MWHNSHAHHPVNINNLLLHNPCIFVFLSIVLFEKEL